jgi:hypothetical protein
MKPADQFPSSFLCVPKPGESGSATARPPWPDELPRIADAFPDLKWTEPLHLRVLVVPATATLPERLVGVAALAEPVPGATEAALFLRIRPRFIDTPANDALLSEAVALAKAAGARTLITGQLSTPDPREPGLRRAGFASAEDGKSWRAVLS